MNVIKKIIGIILAVGAFVGLIAYADHGNTLRYAIGDGVLAIDCDLLTAIVGIIVAGIPFILIVTIAVALWMIGVFDIGMPK